MTLQSGLYVSKASLLYLKQFPCALMSCRINCLRFHYLFYWSAISCWNGSHLKWVTCGNKRRHAKLAWVGNVKERIINLHPLTHTRINSLTRSHTLKHTRTLKHTHTQIHMFLQNARKCTHVHHKHQHASTHTHTHCTHTYTHTYTQTYIRLHTHWRIHTHTTHTFTQTSNLKAILFATFSDVRPIK